MNNFDFKINAASSKDIENYLLECDELFKPRLSKYVDIVEYSIKLHERAKCFELWDKSNLVGLIALYENQNSQTAFISNFSVNADLLGRGIANKFFHMVTEYLTNLEINLIELEVFNANKRAISFYKKIGFFIDKEFENKIRLTKILTKN